MATAETTTLRIPLELRDQIAQLAGRRGTTMLGVVVEAVLRLRRDEWWNTVHDALDTMNAAHAETYRADAEIVDATAPDGIDGD